MTSLPQTYSTSINFMWVSSYTVLDEVHTAIYLSARAFSRPTLYQDTVTSIKYPSNLCVSHHLLKVSVNYAKITQSLSVQPVHSLIFTDICTTSVKKNCACYEKKNGIQNRTHMCSVICLGSVVEVQ